MRALLWKDYRVNRVVLLLGACLLLGPYLAGVGYIVYDAWPEGPPARTWSQTLLACSSFSLALSMLTVIMLGGNAIAGERADRSAEFLAYLPPSRGQVLGSKVLLALATVAVIGGSNALVADVVCPALGDEWRRTADDLPPRGLLTGKGVLLFGAAWLGSSFLSSPAFAVGLGFLVYAVTSMSLQALSTFTGWPAESQLVGWYIAFCLVVGPACFVAGTVYYLRRKEP